MSFKHPKCGGSHNTVAEARDCERGITAETLPGWAQAEDVRAEWSAADREREYAVRVRNGFAGRSDWPKAPRERITEDGMYRNPTTGEIFKVQFPREQKGNTERLYAKRLWVQVGDLAIDHFCPGQATFSTRMDRDAFGADEPKAHFDFAPGVVRQLRPEWRMTLAEAKAFGTLYGTCMDCGRTLTREASIASGIGPKCGEDGRWRADATVELHI